ncbi:MAG: hypothetical protein HYZ13_15230 [Acidobacteria bacterium]|nr:hypothetical protein [Acidobacteriota bacterium]
MRVPTTFRSFTLAALLSPMAAFAHCDTWDGPVVKAAQAALASGEVASVLIWVRKSDETEIRQAFARTREVRKLGGEAQKVADQFFFETLVRVHRAGEGAPYTGLKPAGTDFGPALPAGDRALETGDLKPVWKLLSDRAHEGLHARFDVARKAKDFPAGDVEAGRRFVAAYVTYIHYVEGLYGAAGAPAHGVEGEAHTAHAH